MKLKTISLALGAIASSLLCSAALATPVNCDGGVCQISVGSSSIRYLPTLAPEVVDDGFGFKAKTPGGLQSWVVNGVNRLFAQYSFFRLGGDSRETSLASLLFDNVTSTQDASTGQIHTLYTGVDAPISVELLYTLQGPIPGRFSQIVKDVKVSNKTGAPVDLTWFDYTDLDVNDLGLSDAVRSELHAGTRVITQSGIVSQWTGINQDGNFLFTQPSAFDLGVFGGRLVSNAGQPTILDDLLDNRVTNLDSAPDSFAFKEDFIHAVQFNFSQVNDYVTMRDTLTATVPEPGSLALMTLGLAGLGWAQAYEGARRRESKKLSFLKHESPPTRGFHHLFY